MDKNKPADTSKKGATGGDADGAALPPNVTTFPGVDAAGGAADGAGGAGAPANEPAADDALLAWLGQMGLTRYAPVLAEHAVDFEVLADLEETDLEKIGIPLGHRKKLMRGIATLTDDAVADHFMPFDEPERRQLTIMFCDMVGSTALSQRLDPEDLNDVINAYQDSCREIIKHHSGYVARYSGDGILSYFGFPQARENDPERALRAALDICREIPKLQPVPGEPVHVRIGIATGLVIAGHTVDGDGGAEQVAIGETPNLAARLQGLAEPNTVIVSEQTRKLAGRLFDYADAGVHELKGMSEPVQAWRVTSVRPEGVRFDTAAEVASVPFIGRQAELDLLIEHWGRTARDASRPVLVTGEPGIGKSRIVSALAEHVQAGTGQVIGFQCSSSYTSSALHPFVEHIRRAADIGPRDEGAERFARLLAFVDRAGLDRSFAAPYLAMLLSIPADQAFPLPEVSAGRQLELTLGCMESLIWHWCTGKPTLLVFEDTHWIDPTSEALLRRIVDSTRDSNVMALITSRTNQSGSWQGYPDLVPIAINRLPKTGAIEFIDHLCGGHPLPDEIVTEILDKTDGVPIFVEELTKAILESGMVRRIERFELTTALPPFAIPDTLQDSLMARLDNLGSARRLAQVGACIGRRFSTRLLAAAGGFAEREVAGGLSRLEAADLITRSGDGPDQVCTFKHALVQEVAYESLLRTRRQHFHAQIARLMVASRDAGDITHDEVIARQFQDGGCAREAIDWYTRAARGAAEFAANKEALRHLDAATRLVDTVDASESRTVAELRIELTRGRVLRAVRGTFSPETQAAYDHARSLCDAVGNERLEEDLRSDYQHALYGQSASAFDAADLASAHEAATALIAFGERVDDTAAKLAGRQALGMCEFAYGHLEAAREHLEQALRDGSSGAGDLALRDAQFPSLSLTYLSWTLFILGERDAARARCEEVLRIAGDRSVLFQAITYCNACYTFQFLGDVAQVRTTATRLLELAHQHEMPSWADMGTFFLGWSDLRGGRREQGLAKMRTVIERHAVGDIEMPYMFGLWAESLCECGQLSEALEQVAKAKMTMDRSEERWYEPEIDRLEGELCVQCDPSRESRRRAQASFARAVAGARRRGARTFELRASTSLLRFAIADDERAAACASLRAALVCFEGQRFPEADAARRLLEAADG